MKTYGTCAYATDLRDEIQECVALAAAKRHPSFEGDLQNRLIKETLEELRSGRIDGFGFERLIQTVLVGLGAEEARVVPHNQDKGADVIATFRLAGAFQQVVAVQAKHWKPEPPVGTDVIEQLIRGIEAEDADLGMVVTTGAFSEEATLIAKKLVEENGVKIELALLWQN